MNEKDPRLPVLTLLAIVFTVALTFATLEAPRVLNRILANYLNFPDFHPAIEPELIEEFMNHVRPIGYACLAVLTLLILVGFLTEKTGLSVLGSFALFLPTFGYFAAYMFFLSGIGILRLVWLPIWGPSTKLLKLGDIVYLPYMIIVYPLTLISSRIGIDAESPIVLILRRARIANYYWGKFHLDIRVPLAYGLIGFGLLVFLLGTIAWLYAKFQKGKIVDFWIYRFSRHPQYLGWLIWSYGMMLLASYTPVVRGGENPGASFPWLISSLLVICVALTEEIKMINKFGEEFVEYRDNTPFMFPLPRFITTVMTSPIHVLLKKDCPENGKEVIIVFLVYTVIVVSLSLPFVLLSWPPGTGWPEWPYNTWPW